MPTRRPFALLMLPLATAALAVATLDLPAFAQAATVELSTGLFGA